MPAMYVIISLSPLKKHAKLTENGVFGNFDG
ncbi:MAG: hypothetical protein JWQ42_5162 [Edaphobacter sp.]|nr:hypothetical protein [Edaphobacter sp.]